MNSGAAVDVFSQLKDSINAWISHLRNWSLREGKQWEIGKGRWIISSEWIIISCGVHSTVLSSPQGLSTAPLLPRNKPIQFSLLKENSLVGYVLQVTLVSPWLKKIIKVLLNQAIWGLKDSLESVFLFWSSAWRSKAVWENYWGQLVWSKITGDQGFSWLLLMLLWQWDVQESTVKSESITVILGL